MSGKMGRNISSAVRVVTTTEAFLTLLAEAEFPCFAKGDFGCYMGRNGLADKPCIRCCVKTPDSLETFGSFLRGDMVQTKCWELDSDWTSSFVRMQMNPIRIQRETHEDGIVLPTDRGMEDFNNYKNAWHRLIIWEKKRQFALPLPDFGRVIYHFWNVIDWTLLPMVIWIKVNPA